MGLSEGIAKNSPVFYAVHCKWHPSLMPISAALSKQPCGHCGMVHRSSPAQFDSPSRTGLWPRIPTWIPQDEQIPLEKVLLV